MIKGACWHIAVRQKASGSILSDKTTPFEVKSNPLCGCLMDPLIFEWKGNSYVFAEFFNYFTQRGEIAYCVLKDGKCSKWKTILREKFHLSYPCVFSVNDQIYMIPETSKCDKVLLYKFVHFPDVIEKVSEIKNGCEFVDTTVIKKGKNESFLYTYDLKTKRLLFYKLMSHCVEDWRFNDPDFIVSSRQDQIRPGGYLLPRESIDWCFTRLPRGIWSSTYIQRYRLCIF